ncbi:MULTISPECIES: HNH endonuclease signature motif containing protein [unclassified Brevibacterium]|uniref:HNH endonuclease signature motif containing protein n=1 Tax=unclassified Brevibacterium TaxID=2614124 RepID=UPI001E5F722C|nr:MULTISPECIES: HNH endonuclease signature motif containing protein [unclassified Brevibacterium]MCD1287337.1 hypothetical protein [Brevibacterium sp. CCUG 69071]MDK8436408.1 HNH endonuclease signature motif containing protein [Brevibacterium sp. H-BE7]
MTDNLCSFDGCEKKTIARGYCTKHYQRWSKYGDPSITKPRVRDACSIDDCDGPAVGHGYCTKHYQRFKKFGDPHKVIDRSAGTCSFEDCDRKHYAKGFCASHWKQINRGEEVHKFSDQAIPFEELLWSRVDRTDTCWLWTGPLSDQNYGLFNKDRKTWYAHRYFYTRFKGEIPEGLEIDHICWVTNCVNPDHLRLADRTQQNEYRQGPQKASRTGVRNVHIRKGNRFKKYHVEVGHGGRSYSGGTYYTIEVAAIAAASLRKRLHSRPS